MEKAAPQDRRRKRREYLLHCCNIPSTRNIRLTWDKGRGEEDAGKPGDPHTHRRPGRGRGKARGAQEGSDHRILRCVTWMQVSPPPCIIQSFSGHVSRGLVTVPDVPLAFYPLGSTVIVRHLRHGEGGKQSFLTGHQHPISCVAISKSGKFVATGEEHEIGTKVHSSNCVVLYRN